ncbi:hypothetical protein HPP92_016040 [Vanilla planifolia]|uniref:Uncharacterized protein n=1 Tax=Vanilla planifolia TaxID=51239 RepID=A0A835QTB3_VANPL|nr:hypothetical protein HPP92_016040 [Vanilla planifolia]
MGNANWKAGLENGVSGGFSLSGMDGEASPSSGARRSLSLDAMVDTPPASPHRSRSPFVLSSQHPQYPFQSTHQMQHRLWPDNSQPPSNVPVEKGIPTLISWYLGGDDVAVEGSWDNWTSRYATSRERTSSSSNNDMTVEDHIAGRTYTGQMENGGSFQIFLTWLMSLAKQSTFFKSVESGKHCGFAAPPSPDSSYDRLFPVDDDFAKEPPVVPPQLPLALPNWKSLESGSSPRRPHHVELNHLAVVDSSNLALETSEPLLGGREEDSNGVFFFGSFSSISKLTSPNPNSAHSSADAAFLCSNPSSIFLPATVTDGGAVATQMYLFTNDRSPASYGTKFEDLHPDSQKFLLKIEERIKEYKDECQRLEQNSRLFDSSMSSDSFELDANRILQELGGISIAMDREKVIVQELMSEVKSMMWNTEVAVRSYMILRTRFLRANALSSRDGVSASNALAGPTSSSSFNQSTESAVVPIYDFYSGIPKKPSPFMHFTLARFEKYIAECRQWVEELEQLVLLDGEKNSLNLTS